LERWWFGPIAEIDEQAIPSGELLERGVLSISSYPTTQGRETPDTEQEETSV
jgi:hypothetical protein